MYFLNYNAYQLKCDAKFCLYVRGKLGVLCTSYPPRQRKYQSLSSTRTRRENDVRHFTQELAVIRGICRSSGILNCRLLKLNSMPRNTVET